MTVSFIWLGRTLAVLLSMTSLVSSRIAPNETGYDGTCFVPSSNRPSNRSQLILFDLSLPTSLTATYEGYDYITHPTGTCGIELYFHHSGLYLLEIYASTVNETASKFANFCEQHYTNSDLTPLPWHIEFLTLGTLYPDQPVSPTLVPTEELSRVPTAWLRGLVVRATTDSSAAVGKQILHCSIPYLRPVPNSNFNANFTFEINGCPSGKYGGMCQNRCYCAEGVECHSFNGICMCPRGLRGTQCDQREPELVTEPLVFIPYGESSSLTCTTYGMSPSYWSWTKNGQTIPLETILWEQQVPYTPRPNVLHTTINAENTSANGGYVCEVRDENDTRYTQLVNVTVIAIPDPFIQVAENQTVLAGSNVTFTCQPKTDAGRVKWFKGRNQPLNATEITDKAGQYEILTPSDGVYQLRIYTVDYADEGLYRCYVGHVFRAPDLSYAEALLVVQSAPRPDCSFQDVIDVRSGHPLTLWCLFETVKPVPTLSWRVEGRQASQQPLNDAKLSGDGHSSNVNSSVTFDPAPEDDGKRVIITVASPALNGSQEITALLNVTYAPIVSIHPDPLTLTVGKGAVVKCNAKSNPKPTTFTWKLQHQNKLISNSPPSNGPMYYFKTVSKKLDKASLTCVVKNGVGETEMSVRIKVVEKAMSPAAIAGFSVAGGLILVVFVLASCGAHRYRKEIKLWSAKRAGKDKDDKEYDVFVSYKSGSLDEEFVIHHLIPRLEQDGYRVCVHYKCFLPGKNIIDSISDAVHRSRKTLLLLSPSFIQSEWCRYEFKTALSQMLQLQTGLIPIIFENLGPQENLSEDLQTVLRSLTCLTWPNGPQTDQHKAEEDRQQFWKLLRQALPDSPLGCEGPGREPHLERNEHVCEISL